MKRALRKSDIDKEKFKGRLYELRDGDNYYTQRQAAGRLHISASTWNAWESGQRVPTLIEISAIAAEFGVTLEYLIGLSDDKNEVNRELTYHEKYSEKDEEVIKAYLSLPRVDKEFIATCVNFVTKRRARK